MSSECKIGYICKLSAKLVQCLYGPSISLKHPCQRLFLSAYFDWHSSKAMIRNLFSHMVKMMGLFASLVVVALIGTLVIISTLYASWLGARLLYLGG